MWKTQVGVSSNKNTLLRAETKNKTFFFTHAAQYCYWQKFWSLCVRDPRVWIRASCRDSRHPPPQTNTPTVCKSGSADCFSVILPALRWLGSSSQTRIQTPRAPTQAALTADAFTLTGTEIFPTRQSGFAIWPVTRQAQIRVNLRSLDCIWEADPWFILLTDNNRCKMILHKTSGAFRLF